MSFDSDMGGGGQENENHVRNKRPYPGSVEQLISTKKRVVLGDLTNSSHPRTIRRFSDRAFKATARTATPEAKSTKTVARSGVDSQEFMYTSCIYDHLLSLETVKSRMPLANYMEKVQKDVTPYMREILVDWLVEVVEDYKLLSDTLYLTVSYIDRFLSSHPLNRNMLQLLGVSCMLVASKHEEISPPQVEDFCYVTDNSYTKEEVMTMERDIHNFLNFDVGSPTTKTFLRSLTQFAQDDCETSDMHFEFLGCYLAELSLLEYGCVRFLPSMVASSVVFLSRFIIQPDSHPWTSALQCYSGYTPSELKECVLTINSVQLRRNYPGAVKDKYAQHKFKCVATLCFPPEVPASYFEPVTE